MVECEAICKALFYHIQAKGLWYPKTVNVNLNRTVIVFSTANFQIKALNTMTHLNEHGRQEKY